MAKPKKRPVLRPMTNPHKESTRISVVAAYTTVDVGPRAVVISRPRYATAEERRKAGHQDTEAMLDTIVVTFHGEDQITIKSHVTAIGPGVL